MLGGGDLRDEGPGLGIRPLVLEDQPAVEAGEIVRVGQPDVDDREAAGREVRAIVANASRWADRVARRKSEFSGDEREPERARRRKLQAEQVGLHELDSVRALRACRRLPVGGRARASPGSRSTRGDVVAGGGERNRDPARAAAELEDRAARPRREGEVQVEVARILDEVEVVEAGEGAPNGARRVIGRCRPTRGRSKRTVAAVAPLDREGADRLERRPVARSSTVVLGVVVRRRDLDDVHPGEIDGCRRSGGSPGAARGSCRPPGSGVPVPGASPGSTTSMSMLR